MPFFPLSADLPSLAVANVAYWFQWVGVGISVYSSTGTDPIFPPVRVMAFELEHGKEQERYDHNSRCLEEVKREGRPVLAEHAGFWDLFVPVGRGRTLRGIITAGPFSREPPGPAEIRERWQRLTGHSPVAGDPELGAYVEATFSTPVLDDRKLRLFERLVAAFAGILEARGDAAALRDEVRSLQRKLAVATRLDKMWEMAASMISEDTSRSWWSNQARASLRGLGVQEVPNQLLVALATGRSRGADDPVDDLIHRQAFLRACSDLDHKVANLVCARLGDRGVVLLTSGAGSAERRRQSLLALAQRATNLADRRFGLRLSVGIGPRASHAPLGVQFEQALAAAETAVLRGLTVVCAEPGSQRNLASLSAMRRDLAAAQPEQLVARFDRYAETATVRAGHQLEAVRAHLEAGYERLQDAIGGAGALGPRESNVLAAELDAAAGRAVTVVELVAAFRSAAAKLVNATLRPREARQAGRLRRAIAYIREHYTERLSLARAARVAGIAPGYLSKLIVREQGVSFTRYVRNLRTERAKQLLMTTDVSIGRVGQLCGFPEPHYFHRVFRAAVGATPHQFRARVAATW